MGGAMRAIELLLAQHQTIHDIFHHVIDDMTDEEWVGRVLPKANLPATDLWHVARVYDTLVHTAIRAAPEVLEQEPWASLGVPALFGIGLGMPLEEADAIARSITRADTATYADTVWEQVRAWMVTLSDDDLDPVPDVAGHVAAHPPTAHPKIIRIAGEELAGFPLWRFLSGICGGHRRDHLAEVDMTKQALRQLAAASASPREPTPEPTPVAPDLVAVGVAAAPTRRRRWLWGR